MVEQFKQDISQVGRILASFPGSRAHKSLGTRLVGYKCFVSPVAKQTTSNMVVALCDVVQMCFVGFLIQI